MKYCNRYNHAHPFVGDLGDSLTDQQYKDECDIDLMMKRFRCGRSLPVRASVSYGDFAGIGDYADCLDKIRRAEDEFNALPSRVRERFGHDPRAYMRFILNPSNIEESYKLGIRVKPQKDINTVVVDTLKDIKEAVTRQGEVGAPAASVEQNT